MNIKNKLNYQILILFLFLVLFSLYTGYQCKYPKPGYCTSSFFINYWTESGFIETIQSLFLLISIILIFISNREFKSNKFLYIFLNVKIFALLYYLGEEISWGQHFFHWQTSDFFLEFNNQKETNIHNISNFFDQLPRAIVFIWCSILPLTFLFLEKRLKKNIIAFNIIIPNKILILISLLLIFFFIPDFIIDKFGIHPGHIDEFGKDIFEAMFYDKISFNFIRLSELHELIFTFYFLIYSLNLHKVKKNI